MYEPELLRTFLAVAQTLNFTKAAAALGVRQSTVSQHVQRLEEAVGRALFVRDTRRVTLTADGEALTGFAEEILASHQRAVDHFTGAPISGRLRFGVTDDLALTALPRILRRFRQLYPRVDLELTVLQNESLLRRFESGHLDVVFVKQAAGVARPQRGRLVRRDRLNWVAAEGVRGGGGGKVPLGVSGAQPEPFGGGAGTRGGRAAEQDHLHRERRERRACRRTRRARHRGDGEDAHAG
jgi:DNA-binding transcriptional LysR family regulator